jgi:hypothetical protein
MTKKYILKKDVIPYHGKIYPAGTEIKGYEYNDFLIVSEGCGEQTWIKKENIETRELIIDDFNNRKVYVVNGGFYPQ